jgi:hypothetical protein
MSHRSTSQLDLPGLAFVLVLLLVGAYILSRQERQDPPSSPPPAPAAPVAPEPVDKPDICPGPGPCPLNKPKPNPFRRP